MRCTFWDPESPAEVSGASQKLTSTGRAAPREAVSVYPHTKTSMRILGLDLYARIRLFPCASRGGWLQRLSHESILSMNSLSP